MNPQSVKQAVDIAVRELAGFDAGEREWIHRNALAYLRSLHQFFGPSDVPAVVRGWAEVLMVRELPVLDEGLEEALDLALGLHPGLCPAMDVFCRQLVRRWVTEGNPGFATVGAVFDFILTVEAVVGPEELARFGELTEAVTGRVQRALTAAEPELTAEEWVWLRNEIVSDFRTSEFSPFDGCRDWIHDRHVQQLINRLRQRRAGLGASRRAI